MAMIEALHSGMMVNDSDGGEVSKSFSSVFLSAMLDEAFRDMGMAPTYNPNLDYSDTDERAATRR